MIIYGSKASEIATEKIEDKCSNCGTQNSVQMSVFQKYAHVFWIPFFPLGKAGNTICSHCKLAMQEAEFSSNLKETYENVKANTKTPFWTFSGLALLTVVIVWSVINGKQNDTKNAQLILTPQKRDIYEVKTDAKQYTLYKVNDVIDDSVFLLINQYETNKITGLSDLKNKGHEAYGEDVLPLVKSDLKNMLEKGEIIDIDRK